MEYKKRILVTGGAGFIGSEVVRHFVRKYPEYLIVNFDCLTYAGNLENLKEVEDEPNYEFFKGDIRAFNDVVNAFDKFKITDVIHLAAESHVDRSITGPADFVFTNVVGTFNLLEAARMKWKDDYSAHRFHHVSTDEVYGSLELGNNSKFHETTKYDPHSPYSASKASSDFMVKAFMDTYKFPANITNCSNNYGPYQFPEKLIPLMINNALHGNALPVYGDGKNIRDWLYVEDHCKGIDLVQEKGRLFETYNIGGHNERENIQIVKTIISTLREELSDSDPRKEHISEDLIKYVEDRKGHDRRYAIAPDKIKAEVGWYPETTFEVGIKKTIRWYFDHQEWMEHVTSGDYQKYYEDMYANK
jgi:dTDP-glucose 4,6-dehydratase